VRSKRKGEELASPFDHFVEFYSQRICADIHT
jgi:hypothetical protein